MSDLAQSPRKFNFDVEFEGGRSGASGSAYRRSHSAEDVERLVAQARAEGEAAAMARIEAQTAQALSNMAETAKAALPTLAQAAHLHRESAAELALACARQIADAACERFPEAPLQAALAALAREIEATPKLLFRCNPALEAQLTAALAQTAEAIGYAGQIVARPDPLIPRAGFILDWGDGSAAFDPDGAAARVAEALKSALAAEGLHAEALALNPSTEA
ncbi:MAG TPA: flagellar assembly protein FliH [Caulobacteraceae bacterium]|jgi:flagellar assembly protein FliH